MTERWYVSPTTGDKYRLVEADHDKLISSSDDDFKRGIIGDSLHCLKANAAMRREEVVEAFIGSGRDSVLVEKRIDEIVAVHYINSAGSSRIRDAFDQDQDLGSYLFTLRKPAVSETFEARADRFRRNRATIKLENKASSGKKRFEVQVKTNGKVSKTKAATAMIKSKKKGNWPQPKVKSPNQRRSRVERLGVPHRAKLPIITVD